MIDIYNSKKFSIGLNMDVDIDSYTRFIDQYSKRISSIYFSLPLGRKFYSRTELENEYETNEANEKLIYICNFLKKNSIRREVTVNTYNLDTADLKLTEEYMIKHDIIPEEIVCLSQYGEFYKTLFPNVELKYSFNNTDNNVPDFFDTVVVGKGFLRNKEARHKIIDRGKNLVLLLNNGCSFSCHYECGDSKFCGTFLTESLKTKSLNEVYAIQSFFPLELKRLLQEDDYADKYKYKISNRPLGIDFTKTVLDCYCSLEDVKEIIEKSINNYGLFCVMQQLYVKRDIFDLEEIMNIKNQLLV